MLLYMGIEGWVNTYTSTWFTSMSICDCVCGSKTWVRYWYPKQEGNPHWSCSMLIHFLGFGRLNWLRRIETCVYIYNYYIYIYTIVYCMMYIYVHMCIYTHTYIPLYKYRCTNTCSRGTRQNAQVIKYIVSLFPCGAVAPSSVERADGSTLLSCPLFCLSSGHFNRLMVVDWV